MLDREAWCVLFRKHWSSRLVWYLRLHSAHIQCCDDDHMQRAQGLRQREDTPSCRYQAGPGDHEISIG
jgi:hypothetical protein